MVYIDNYNAPFWAYENVPHDSGQDKPSIIDFWLTKPYRLTIPPILSNCDLCFMKGEDKIIAILTNDITLADKWISDEENPILNPNAYTYCEKHTMRELRDISQSFIDKGKIFDLTEMTAKFNCFLYSMITPQQLEAWKVNTFANENQFQAAAYQMLNNEFWQFRGLVWHVVNEGKKGMRQAANDKAMGLLPGNPDIHIKYRGVLFTIELKQPDGYLSPSQKILHPIFNADFLEIPVVVCKTMYEVYMYALWILDQNFTVYRDI